MSQSQSQPQQTITLWKVVDSTGTDYSVQLTEEAARQTLARLASICTHRELHVEKISVATDLAEAREPAANSSPCFEAELWEARLHAGRVAYSLGLFPTEKEAQGECEKAKSRVSTDVSVRRIVVAVRPAQTGFREETTVEESRRLVQAARGELAVLQDVLAGTEIALQVTAGERDRYQRHLQERTEERDAARKERDEAMAKLKAVTDYLAN